MKGLHTIGYTIHRSILPIDQKELRKLREHVKSNSRAIFNFNRKKKQDFKRKQVSLPKRLVPNVYKTLNEFAKTYYSNLMSKEWVILLSLAGCQEQAPHCDYIQDEKFKTIKNKDVPLGCIVCLEEDTKINVWDNSIRIVYNKPEKPIRKRKVNLNIGDIFVFRGDLVHAGAAYDKENIRIHGYLDSKVFKRKTNTTYIIDRNAPDEVADLINEI